MKSSVVWFSLLGVMACAPAPEGTEPAAETQEPPAPVEQPRVADPQRVVALAPSVVELLYELVEPREHRYEIFFEGPQWNPHPPYEVVIEPERDHLTFVMEKQLIAKETTSEIKFRLVKYSVYIHNSGNQICFFIECI